MASSEDPLDEIQHRRRDVIDWWTGEGGQPMEPDLIHRYLRESPYFDHTTKNGQHFHTAERQGDPRALTFVSSRQLMEDGLRREQGIEYMIVEDPQPVKDGTDMPPTGTSAIYVIRKQDRQRVRGYDGKITEELTTLATYYTAGECLYQACSVADTVGNRLLVAQKHIAAFADAANELPSFDPALGGHYYLRPSSKATTASASASTPGAAGSPGRGGSREASVAVDGSSSVRSGSVEPSVSNDHPSAGGDTAQQAQENRLLSESLSMAVQFGDEYADENPIVGEPGRFTFTSSTAAVRKRKADEEAARTRAEREREGKVAAAGNVEGRVKVPVVPAIMTDGKGARGEKEKKAVGKVVGEKAKRRKSKGNALLNPTTPGAGGGSAGAA